MATREDVLAYVSDNYGTKPDYPWDDTPDAAVLRKPSRKWYGLLMNVKRSSLGIGGEGTVDVLNAKCSEAVRECLIAEGKAIPAYHMNKRLWITVILDGRASCEEVFAVLDESYSIVK